MPFPSGKYKRGSTLFVLHVHVRPRRQQLCDHRLAPFLAGNDEGRPALAVGVVHRGTALNQQPRDGLVAVPRGEVQRGPAVVVHPVDVRAAPLRAEQHPRDGLVAVPRGVVQRGRAAVVCPLDVRAAPLRPEQRPLIFGSTDSEHLFHYLLSAMAEQGVDPTGHADIVCEVAGRALRDAVDALYVQSRGIAEDHPIVNFILTNGDTFFAMRAGKELYLSTQKVSCGDAETTETVDVILILLFLRFSAGRASSFVWFARLPRVPEVCDDRYSLYGCIRK